jgi:hypothetical protein
MTIRRIHDGADGKAKDCDWKLRYRVQDRGLCNKWKLLLVSTPGVFRVYFFYS